MTVEFGDICKSCGTGGFSHTDACDNRPPAVPPLPVASSFIDAVAAIRCEKCKRRGGKHMWTCPDYPTTVSERRPADDDFDDRLGSAKLRVHFPCGNCMGDACLQWRTDCPSEIQVFCLDCTAPKVPMHDLLEFGESVKKERQRK